MNSKLDMVAHSHTPRTPYAQAGENQNRKNLLLMKTVPSLLC